MGMGLKQVHGTEGYGTGCKSFALKWKIFVLLLGGIWLGTKDFS